MTKQESQGVTVKTVISSETEAKLLSISNKITTLKVDIEHYLTVLKAVKLGLQEPDVIAAFDENGLNALSNELKACLVSLSDFQRELGVTRTFCNNRRISLLKAKDKTKRVTIQSIDKRLAAIELKEQGLKADDQTKG